jgi:hypothetical protein
MINITFFLILKLNYIEKNVVFAADGTSGSRTDRKLRFIEGSGKM